MRLTFVILALIGAAVATNPLDAGRRDRRVVLPFPSMGGCPGGVCPQQPVALSPAVANWLAQPLNHGNCPCSKTGGCHCQPHSDCAKGNCADHNPLLQAAEKPRLVDAPKVKAPEKPAAKMPVGPPPPVVLAPPVQTYTQTRTVYYAPVPRFQPVRRIVGFFRR